MVDLKQFIDPVFPPPPVVPEGECHCGCGRKTKIALESSTRLGWVRGRPIPFASTHRPRRMPEPVRPRFWSQVNKNGPMHPLLETRCWLWEGTISPTGYGGIALANGLGKSFMAVTHRVSWYIRNGDIPKGKMVLHKCDVRNCVRPGHLFLGTHRDNMRDMSSKQRRSGERNPKHTLTDKDVQKMRRMWNKGISQRRLSKIFPVALITVSRICRGVAWAHIAGEPLRKGHTANYKLTRKDIRKVIRMRLRGMMYKDIAAIFGVNTITPRYHFNKWKAQS